MPPMTPAADPAETSAVFRLNHPARCRWQPGSDGVRPWSSRATGPSTSKSAYWAPVGPEHRSQPEHRSPARSPRHRRFGEQLTQLHRLRVGHHDRGLDRSVEGQPYPPSAAQALPRDDHRVGLTVRGAASHRPTERLVRSTATHRGPPPDAARHRTGSASAVVKVSIMGPPYRGLWTATPMKPWGIFL